MLNPDRQANYGEEIRSIGEDRKLRTNNHLLWHEAVDGLRLLGCDAPGDGDMGNLQGTHELRN